MGITALAFYLFAFIAVAAGFMVVMSRNPVHSVLWLILTFFTAAGLFVLMGAEFVAMLLVIVYVGAVAVLFLFVVMMLDVDFVELKGGVAKFLPLALLIGLILLGELALVTGHWIFAENMPQLRAAVAPMPEDVHNTAALGMLIYTKYIFLFQIAGLILLVAMIGAIVLTMRHRTDVKRQDVLSQMYRDPAKAVIMKDIKPGQGI
ncbi:NADH-quinone oxidoreductase subunit J [Abyssibius alkaniclasticus]|uniref:NADH-quinone oxidoreductase subunit J n=1 Tax=Abyssibius alkaniclasticus TaxID=2881234 RepID=UPI0023638B27|nr:NADH-quinone oxidoreductase subunit J [Abyssibius alkaniclasticus]UPH70735.1 NADH-quinone oxidoreductase subunit J [Abyssibius alkaniclasticus]|tara:strand:- start:899 stop:1513 length:615 start_codon:yes stop_codon:yes gene_type:complete